MKNYLKITAWELNRREGRYSREEGWRVGEKERKGDGSKPKGGKPEKAADFLPLFVL